MHVPPAIGLSLTLMGKKEARHKNDTLFRYVFIFNFTVNSWCSNGVAHEQWDAGANPLSSLQ